MAQVQTQMTPVRPVKPAENYVENYKKQLASYTDPEERRRFAEKQTTANYGHKANLIGLANANKQYFSGPYDFGAGNYDDWSRNQKLTNYAGNLNSHLQAEMLQKYQQGVAGHRATQFAQNLPQYIEGETSGLKDALSQRMGDSRKNLLAEYNRRGLLRSGQKGMAETNMASDFAGQFEQGRSDIYKKAQDQAQQLFSNPALKGLGYDARALDMQKQLEQMKAQQSSAKSQLFGGAMGMIGQGIGSYYGAKQPGLLKQPTMANNQMPGTMVG